MEQEACGRSCCGLPSAAEGVVEPSKEYFPFASPLHAAAYRGDVAEIKSVLQNQGTNINGNFNVPTAPAVPTAYPNLLPFTHDVILCHISILSFPSPLPSSAIFSGNTGIDSQGASALHYAVYRHHTRCVKVLMKNGASLEPEEKVNLMICRNLTKKTGTQVVEG